MSKDPLDRVKDVIRTGDIEASLEALDKLYTQLGFLHDAATCWLASLQTHIYRKYGLEALKEAEWEAHHIEGSLQMLPPENDDFKTVVEHTCRMINGHFWQPVTVTEDDEKVMIKVHPCGSGNRVVAKGWYGDDKLARVKEACDITWQCEDFPIYCVHCPIQELMEIERTGYLKFAHHLESEAGPGSECCTYLIYKNRDDIPEFYYDRIGVKKPAPAE